MSTMDSSFSSSGYLPPFLLGSPSRRDSHVSSTKQSRNAAINLSPNPSHGVLDKSFGVKLNLPERNESSHYGKLLIRGPPVQELHENYVSDTSTPIMPASPERRQLNFTSINDSNKSVQDHLLSEKYYTENQEKTSSGSIFSPAQLDPFYSKGEEVKGDEPLDQCWITVFGFPPSSSSFILDQFSQYGSIVKHKVTSNGNWMHILYQSKMDANKALSKNGKVFGNGIMVGVQHCIDISVMNESERSLHCSLQRPRTIRPLSAAFQASTSHNQVIQSQPNVPQKSHSVFSKALEYIFGW